MSRNVKTALSIGGVIIAILVAIALAQTTPKLAVFWLFGLGFGFIMQRSRFCFTAAFRDLFLLRDGRMMKGVLGGLAVATVGFALVMSDMVPKNLDLGILPLNVYVIPLGFHLLLAGVMFGLGMVVAGSCFAGTLYRIGEGYAASLVTLAGILVGLGVLLHNWNWWWQSYISLLPMVWLPHSLGWAGAIGLTLAVLVIGYLAVRWWESRGGMIARRVTEKQPTATMGQKLGALRRTVLVKAWPVALAGVLLGALNTVEYLFERPWGLTGEFSRWSGGLLSLIRLPAPEPIGLAGP